MAGNRKAFDKAMKKAASHAWNKSWAKAIKEYERALKELPGDKTALLGLGVARLESNSLDSAKVIFDQLHAAEPNDPIILGHLASVEEQLSNIDRASELFMELGITYREEGDLRRAVKAWTDVAQHSPSFREAQENLVQAYTELGETDQAVLTCVSLARGYQSNGEITEMVHTLQTALQLDPANREAHRLLELAHVTSDIGLLGSDNGLGPIEATRKAAWAELAQILFEDLSVEMMSDTDVVPADQRMPPQSLPDKPLERNQVIALIGRAVDLDTKGHVDGAIQAYREVIRNGVDRVAVHFNLGLLYKSQNHLEESCRHLAITRFHPGYALASYLALAECYQLHNRFDLAMQHYVNTLKITDLQLVNEARVAEVAAIYDSLVDGYSREGKHGAQEATINFFNTVRAFFRAEDWLERARSLRTTLDGLSPLGMMISLVDGLQTSSFDNVFSQLQGIRDLVDQGKLLTAREECYRMLEKEPTYLPFHFQLADISIQHELIEDAVSKYMIIAEVYLVGNSFFQASNMYKATLSLTPLDVQVRVTLIDLLIERKEIDQAIEQYLSLADAYYQLARVDTALETFNEALRLTERSRSPQAWRLKILFFMADLYTQRVEWNKAIEIYEEIRGIAPEDEQSGLHLMDLYFKQGKPEQASRELQKLIQSHKKKNDNEGLITLLREAMRLQPHELSIRASLSQAYIESGLTQEAITELDAIGEMQLEAEMRDEAIQTIRLIISLKPSNVRAYKQLLYHLLS